MVMLRPNADVDEWAGSFSQFLLCADPPDAEVSIVAVRPLETMGTVRGFQDWVATPDRDRPPRWLIFISVLGRAPALAEGYTEEDSERYSARLQEDFEFHDLSDPVSVDAVCSEPEEAPNVMFSFETDREGGMVRSWEVIYESNGQRYTSGPVHWEAGLCGTHHELAEHCEGPPNGPDGGT